MNSDPHESAAWRIFGLLDADEAAGFDEAMRDDLELKNAFREIECLTAAVAVATTPAVTPRPGQLGRLQLKLGLNPSKDTNWFGISGWAAAAALTMLLVFQHEPEIQNPNARNVPPTIITSPQAPSTNPSGQTQSVTAGTSVETPSHPQDSQHAQLANTTPQQETKIIVQVETRQLVREIEILREKLETIQQQERQRLEPVPGMAWPIVMRMTPPRIHAAETGNLALEKDSPDITTILGDALAAVASGETPPESDFTNTEPSAIQIYDPAIDAGTLVVSNLPNTADDEEFSLFVSQKPGDKPILVGHLPKTKEGRSKSFDYALGSNVTIPAAFTLIKNKRGKVAEPNAQNTVLRGPR